MNIKRILLIPILAVLLLILTAHSYYKVWKVDNSGNIAYTGNATITGSMYIDDSLAVGDVGSPTFEVKQNGDMRMLGATETALFFWDHSLNRVGIGTAEPAEQFHITSAGNAGFRVDRNSTANYAQLNFYAGGVKDWQFQVRADTDNGRGIVLRNADNVNRFIVEQDGDIYSGVNGQVENYINVTVYNDSTITGEDTFTQPAGYFISYIAIKNGTANLVTDFDIGYTDGGGEIIAANDIAISQDWDNPTLLKKQSGSAAVTCYVSAGNWNGATVLLYVKFEKLINVD